MSCAVFCADWEIRAPLCLVALACALNIVQDFIPAVAAIFGLREQT